MTLKYYADERARYGEMGPITEAEVAHVITAVAGKYNVPLVKFHLATRRKNVSVYRGGLGMMYLSLRLYKPLAVPGIHIAPTMMNWLTVLHELAHHIHICRFDAKIREAAQKAGVPVDSSFDSRYKFREFAFANFKKEHAHGPSHRAIVQELVSHFVDSGDIKVLPTYKVKS